MNVVNAVNAVNVVNAEFLPQINPDKCIGCELCVKQCPTQALEMADDLPVVANPKACDYNGVCQEICPTEAISLIYELIFAVDFSEGGKQAYVHKAGSAAKP